VCSDEIGLCSGIDLPLAHVAARSRSRFEILQGEIKKISRAQVARDQKAVGLNRPKLSKKLLTEGDAFDAGASSRLILCAL
jgi:hypothetical protein